MLRTMREKHMTYPGYGKASTPEKWEALLDEMIEGWEAAARMIALDYPDGTINESFKADNKIFKTKSKVFSEWFLHLWD